MKKIITTGLVLAGLMVSQEILAQVRVNIGIGIGRPFRYGGFYHRSNRIIMRPEPVIIASACEDLPVIIEAAPVVIVPRRRIIYIDPPYYTRRHFRRRW